MWQRVGNHGNTGSEKHIGGAIVTQMTKVLTAGCNCDGNESIVSWIDATYRVTMALCARAG